MGEPVSDLDLMDMDAEELGRYIDGLEAGPQPTPEEQAELLAQLPPADPETPITVVTSLRLPHELKRRIDTAATADGVSASSFIRTAVERVLAGRDREALVNLDDAMDALRRLPHAA